MKILIAGGTGFLGRHIARALLDDEHSVTILSRSPHKIADVPELRGAGAVRGDVTDPTTLPAAVDGQDALVGTMTFPNFPVEQPRKQLTFHHYDYQGTANLLAAAEAAGVARYLYISGAGADPASDKSWYRAKGMAEDAVERSSLEHLILRPSWAYGPEDKALNRYVTMTRFLPFVPKLGVSPQRIMPVYVGDIARAVSKAFATDEAWNATYEIGGPEVMTMDEVIATLCEVLGRSRVVVPIPAWLAKLGTAPLVMLPTPPMSPGAVEFAVQDGLVDTTLTEKVLDVRPLGLRDGLRRYLP